MRARTSSFSELMAIPFFWLPNKATILVTDQKMRSLRSLEGLYFRAAVLEQNEIESNSGY